jgi:hypothetical protein
MSTITLSDEGFDPRAGRQRRLERLARIKAAAVPDHGIDLKRERHIEPPPPPSPPSPMAMEVTMVVQEIVAPPAPEPKPKLRSVTQYGPISRIQRTVSEFYGITRIELLSRCNIAVIVKPRHVAIYLARKLTSSSAPEIGRRFSRDHSSVLHAINRIQGLMDDETQTVLHSEVSHLINLLSPPEESHDNREQHASADQVSCGTD